MLTKLNKNVKGLAAAIAISLALLPALEGKENVAYQDVGKVWTICFGHTGGVRAGQKATDEQCIEYAQKDLEHAHAVVRSEVKTPMTAERESGLALFTINVGEGNFRRSTLLKKLNSGHPKACDELRRWFYAAGRDCRIKSNDCYGLVNRRELERSLCMKN